LLGWLRECNRLTIMAHRAESRSSSVFDVALAGTLVAACGFAKPQAEIEPNSRYTDFKTAVAPGDSI
jgi:hypothetical protein